MTTYAPGTKVRYLHGGFTGTVVSDMGYDSVLVRWDTHFGVAVDSAPRHLLTERI